MIGPIHVLRFISVPKESRAEFQVQAVREGWSRTKLDAEIRSQFGKRRQAGRKPRLPSDVDEFQMQKLRRCEAWQAWDRAMRDGMGPRC